jgi:hypothetical protein
VGVDTMKAAQASATVDSLMMDSLLEATPSHSFVTR